MAVERFVTKALDEEFLLDAGNTGGTFGIPTFIASSPCRWGLTVGTTFKASRIGACRFC
jgi:iron complex outermembrane recepter protein